MPRPRRFRRPRVYPLLVLIATLTGAGLIGVALSSATARTVLPTITGITPHDGPIAGGTTVTVTGTGFAHVSKVSFTRARGGNVHVLSSSKLTVTAPKHPTGRTYLHVTTPNGTSVSVAAGRYTYRELPRTMQVSSAKIDRDTGSPSAISCAGSSFCAVVDQYGNAVVTKDGSTWSTPVDLGLGLGQVDLTAVPPDPVVSCTSASFCLAVGGARWSAFNGTAWRSGSLPGGATGVACVSSTLCLAVDGSTSSWHRFDGTGWSTIGPPAGATGYRWNAISCSGASFCAATGSNPSHFYATTYTGGATWTAPATLSTGADAISCASSTFCVAVGGASAQQFDGTTWSTSVIDSGHQLSDVSCPSATYCVAVDDATYGSTVGHSLTYGGSSWTTPAVVTGGSLAAVSCWAAASCRAVTTSADGAELTLTGTAWSRPTVIDPAAGYLLGTSCPTATFCAAVDQAGNALTFRSGHWSLPVRLVTGTPLVDVSCASASFCVAMDARGSVYRYTGSAWSAGQRVDSHGQSSAISCPSPSFCTAVDSAGYAVQYSGGGWHAPKKLLTYGGLSSVSCVSGSFCYAVGGGGSAHAGLAVRFDGTWATQRKIRAHDELGSVSCTASTFCAVSAGAAGVLLYTGTAWSAPIAGHMPRGATATAVECVLPTFCLAKSVDGSESDRPDPPTYQVIDGGSARVQPIPYGDPLYEFDGALTCWAKYQCLAVSNQAAYRTA